jgi:predicted MFS family arabinose efflux permease
MAARTTLEHRGWLSALLFSGMGISTFTAGSMGILASFIIDDLSISRARLGFALAVVNVASALLSPIAGRVTDRIGGRTALVVLFAAATITFIILGVAFAYVVLLLGALAGSFSQSSANPSTNKLIAESIPMGERGLIVGIKQSGVQAGIFLGGLTLPTLAQAVGWRGAYLVVAAGPLLLAGLTLRIVPPSTAPTEASVAGRRATLPPAIWWLTGYGCLMGFSFGVSFLVPLFTEEVIGLSPVGGGLAAATIALIAVVGRIAWSRFAERYDAYLSSLSVMAALATVAAGLFFLAGSTASWLLWPACLIVALGSGSWNSVGMLTLMVVAGPESTGRASGFVLLGFLTGLGIAPPVFGALIDRTESYNTMWLLSATAALLALVASRVWATRSERS